MKLDEILEEFKDLDPRESLETLIEMSRDLPELSVLRAAERHDGRRLVRECRTPVYLWVDVTTDGVRLEAHVTEQSPTVRGYVAMLVTGITGASPQEVSAISDDLLSKLGLDSTLGMTRRPGFVALLRRIKQEVASQAGKTTNAT